MGYFSAYRHMTEENPDLVIFLGDYIYENTYADAQADRIVRKHDGQPPATSPAIAIATPFIAPMRICRPSMERRRA